MNRYLQIGVVLCVLLASVVPALALPAAAQAGANASNGSNSSAEVNSSGGSNLTALRPEPTSGAGGPSAAAGAANATNVTNASGGNGGGSGVIGGVTGAAEGAWNSATPDVPTTEEIANDTATWAKNKTLNGTQFMLNKSMNFTVGTTHPVNSGPNGIFGTPTNEPYKSLYDTVYGPFSFQYSVLILVILLFAMIMVLPYAGLASGGSYRIVQAGARIMAALVLIMFWWPIGSALSQFFDAVAMGIAPTPEELTTSMNGIFKLSLGPVLVGLAIYLVDMVTILALAFIYAFRQAALIVFQFAMPLLLVFAYGGPHRRVRSMASTIAWQYFALLTMTIPTAFLLRIGFEAEWGFGLGVLGNAIISIGLLGLALAVPIVFSISAFRAPAAMQSLAYGAAGSAIGSAATAKSRIWERDEEDENDGGQQTVYVEDTPASERVAATDGGTTNYTDATAGKPPSAGALHGTSVEGGTAERIRNFEQKISGKGGGSAAAQTRHYNSQSDPMYVDSTVVNDGEGGE